MSRVLLLLAALCVATVASDRFFSQSEPTSELKKVGFINGLQGQYDSQIIISLLRQRGILYEEMGPTWTPLREFLRPLGALVVSGNPWAGKPQGWPAALSDEDAEALRSWIHAGGHLLFIYHGALMLKPGKGGKLPEWLGFTELREVKEVPIQDVVIAQPRHPFIAHVAGAGKRPWMSGGYAAVGMDGGDALIDLTGDKTALLYVRTMGRGQVVHFGRQTFRFERKTLKSLPRVVRRQQLAQEQAAAVRQTILEQQGVLRAVVEQWPGLATTRSILLARETQLPLREGLFAWYRDPDDDRQRALPEFFHDPAPRADELLKEFTLDVGRKEFESFFFYLTNFGPQRELSVTVSDLTGPSSQKMPATQIEVRVQSAILTPEPKPAARLRGKEQPIWLYRPAQLPPVGREAFDVGSLEHRVVWLTLSPWEGPAGVYRGTIEIRAGNKTAFAISLTVTVFDVPVRHDLVSLFNNIESVTLLPGTPLREDKWDATRYHAYLKLLRDYGSDLAEVIGPTYSKHRKPVIQGTDLTIPEAIKRKPELLRGEKLPALDFSWFTPFLNPVVAQGFRGLVSLGGFNPPCSVEELRALYGDESLTWDSPPGQRLHQWYLSEWLRYIRELGFDGQRLRKFDEIDEKGDDAIKLYLRDQAVAQAAGFKTGSTFQFYNATNRDRIRELDPVTSCWMITARWSLGFYEATEGLKTIDPTDEVLLCPGWRWENYTYDRAQEELWQVFYPIAGVAHRIGLYYAGLIRTPQLATVVEDERGFIVAQAMEAYRDALDAIKLYRALRLARNRMETEQKAALDRELSKVVSVDADALIRFERGSVDRKLGSYESKNIPILTTPPEITLTQYRQAKRRLLELSVTYGR
jgi:hypothetical protein